MTKPHGSGDNLSSYDISDDFTARALNHTKPAECKCISEYLE